MGQNEFYNFATRHLRMSGSALDSYQKTVNDSYISPSILEERQLNVTQMDVFSRLMMDRIIFLGTPIDDYVANVIQAQLLFLDTADPGKDISIYINSPGGSVHAGLGIYDTMQSRVMIHQPMGGMQGQASDMEINYRQIMLLRNELYQIIADHSGQPFEKIEKDSDRDFWMTSQEALDYGMIDKVLTREKKDKE